VFIKLAMVGKKGGCVAWGGRKFAFVIIGDDII